MPKSKRNKVVHLTQTKSRGMERKIDLVEKVRNALDNYKTIYIFKTENMRTNYLKEIRVELHDCRFFLGNNKILQLALGRTKEDAYLKNINQLAKNLVGNVGLLLTNRPIKEIETYFKDYTQKDYARTGFVAQDEVVLPKGPIENVPSSMIEEFRSMKLPVVLNKGIIEIEYDYTLCKKGQVIVPEVTRALKFFDYKLAEFKIILTHRFRGGELKELVKPEENNENKMAMTDDSFEDDGIIISDPSVTRSSKKKQKSKTPKRKTRKSKAQESEDMDDY